MVINMAAAVASAPSSATDCQQHDPQNRHVQPKKHTDALPTNVDSPFSESNSESRDNSAVLPNETDNIVSVKTPEKSDKKQYFVEAPLPKTNPWNINQSSTKPPVTEKGEITLS